MQLSDFVYWIDLNLPPKAAVWLKERFNVAAFHLSGLFELDIADAEIFKRQKSKLM